MSKPAVSSRLEKIDEQYQLAIIGGGIYGAALCWEAAHRGIKTVLIEQEDYACGASSNSLKTIHGGLRSLQSINLGAVIKGIRERANFMRIAPNYVKPLPCVLPTTHSLMKSRVVVGLGLFLYNMLCFMVSLFSTNAVKVPYARLLSRRTFLRRAPQIEPERVTGGALWYDAQVTNTERLVLQFIKSAIKKGAIAINHTIAVKLEQNTGNSGHSVVIRDQLTGEEKIIFSEAIVDCTSAWDFIRRSLPTSEMGEDLTFLKSINLVVRKSLFENAVGASTRQCGNPRLYFFSPWRDCTLIGTWYGAVDNYTENKFSHAEAVACVDEINTVFNQKVLDVDDISNIHIGFLPASKNSSRDPAAIDKDLISRYQLKDWSRQLGEKHVYSLRGTKYTLARHDARQVIDALSKTMKWRASISKSDQLPIYDVVSTPGNVKLLPNKIMVNLVMNYGSEIEHIIKHIKKNPGSSEIIPGTQHHIMAEIYHVIFHEQALTLCDLLKRRLDIGDRAPPELKTAKYCAAIMQNILSWSDEIMQTQIDELYASYPDFLTKKYL